MVFPILEVTACPIGSKISDPTMRDRAIRNAPLTSLNEAKI